MKRQVTPVVELGVVTLLWVSGLLYPSARAQEGPQFSIFPIPTLNSGSYHATAGPDGSFWFAEQSANKIAKLTPDGTFTEYPIPTPFSFPSMITPCPDGALWFTETLANQIGRLNKTGSMTEFPVPTANSRPFGITCQLDYSDLHLDVLFSEANANQIGWLRQFPDHFEISEIAVPTLNSTPGPITFGPDGNIWFTEFTGNSGIARMTPSGTFTEFSAPTPSIPFGLTVGPDSALWFTEYIGDHIGRITTSGEITEFATPTAFGLPFAITAGPEGSLWFTLQSAAKVGTITTGGTIQEWPFTPGTGPSGTATLVTAPDTGYVAVMQADANAVAIARTNPPLLEFTKTASPDPVPVGGVLTYTMTATNHGTGVLTYCWIADDYPTEISLLPFQADWVIYGDDAESTTFNLNPNETKQLQLRATPDVGGDTTNKATLYCRENPPVVSKVTSHAQ